MERELQSYLKENALHGTREFPAGFYPTQIPLTYQDMLVHWHEEMEFARVSGGALYYVIDQVRYALHEGDILLIAPDSLHSAHQLQQETAAVDSIVFHLRLAGLENSDACTRRYVQPLQEGQLRFAAVLHPGEALYAQVNACFAEMWECRNPELPYRELRFKTQVFTLISLLWQLSDSNVLPLPSRTFRQYEDKLKLALAYMQEHYAETIAIRDLADLCGFSQVHFMNIFKAALGCTCIEYLVEYRLARAAMQLQETDHSIMQIALDNGFQNTSYFNRAFKRQYGVTPSAFRKRPR